MLSYVVILFQKPSRKSCMAKKLIHAKFHWNQSKIMGFRFFHDFGFHLDNKVLLYVIILFQKPSQKSQMAKKLIHDKFHWNWSKFMDFRTFHEFGFHQCFYMLSYFSKNHLESHIWQKNSSTQNFMRIKARSWILDFFMVFGFHSNNKVSLYDLLLV